MKSNAFERFFVKTPFGLPLPKKPRCLCIELYVPILYPLKTSESLGFLIFSGSTKWEHKVLGKGSVNGILTKNLSKTFDFI